MQTYSPAPTISTTQAFYFGFDKSELTLSGRHALLRSINFAYMPVLFMSLLHKHSDDWNKVIFPQRQKRGVRHFADIKYNIITCKASDFSSSKVVLKNTRCWFKNNILLIYHLYMPYSTLTYRWMYTVINT